MSAKYRQDIIGILRQVYHDALHSGVLDRSQVPVWPQIKVHEKGFDVLTMDEQDEILKKVPDHDKPIYLFMFTYGVRPSEARALKTDAIIGDLESLVIRRTFSRGNKLRDNPKEGRWRVIPLTDDMREMISSLPKSLTGFIFVNRWGRPYSQSYVNDTWNAACTEAGFSYIPLRNATRHSLGTRLANEGMGKELIATVLGHTNTNTTSRYVRYAADPLRPFFERKRKGRKRRASVTKLSPR